MDEKMASPNGNSVTSVPIIGDINNRRFVTAILAGLLGGTGVASVASLLRGYLDRRKPNKDETDDETIVLTLPGSQKVVAAECRDGYAGMCAAKPGEAKVVSTAKDGTQQLREAGRFGKRIGKPAEHGKGDVKCAEGGNPGPHSVGTMVANALALTFGGLVSYEGVSRLFDALNERRLKRKLRAAQEAYVSAMTGASKRAEAVASVIAPAERVFCRGSMEKEAWSPLDLLPDPAANTIRYPAALYLLALIAGTGATAYVTKKVMDKQFPEEKLRKDINRPTRIVFRTSGAEPVLLEGDKGSEKHASADTCAAVTAMLPIYMDIVEGAPRRTLAEPYVKIAAAAGTDSAGLMDLAKKDMSAVYRVILSDPEAVWAILRGTNFGLNFNRLDAAHILRDARPDTYRTAVDAFINSRFAGKPGDGFIRRSWNTIARAGTKAFADFGGRDYLVDNALKSASVEDLVTSAFTQDAQDAQDGGAAAELPDEDVVVDKIRRKLRRRGILVEAADPGAARYVRRNGAAIRGLLARLHARGTV